MKRVLLSAFLLIILCLSVGSCTVEKRLHRKGYHISWNKKKVKSQTSLTEKEKTLALKPVEVEQSMPDERVAPTFLNHGEDQSEPVSAVIAYQEEELEEFAGVECSEDIEVTNFISDEVAELAQSKEYESIASNESETSAVETSQINSENNASAGGSALSVIGWILIILGIIFLIIVSILIGILLMLTGLGFVLGGAGMRRKG